LINSFNKNIMADEVKKENNGSVVDFSGR